MTKKMFGVEGAKIASQYRLSVKDEAITLLSYLGNDENIIVPERIGSYPVVALGEGCFEEGHQSQHQSKIKSVVVPGTISVLPEQAFDYCKELESVTLSDGMTSIEGRAFNQCDKLKSISIPNTVITIGESAFNSCKSLKSIFIPAGVRTMESSIAGCDSLETITVDSANEKYDSRDNCNAVVETATNTIVIGCKSTVIPNTVTAIGESAFCALDSIEEFVVPEGITEIGNNAFSSCFNLKSIRLPQSLLKIGYYAFYFCRELKKVELPPKLTAMHVSVFGNCESLTELVINDKLAVIEGLDQVWKYNYWRIKTFYGSSNSIAKAVAEACRGKYIEL